MIRSKKELSFYIMADRMMNRGTFTRNYTLKRFLSPDYIMEYLYYMRKASYYNFKKGGWSNRLLAAYYNYKFLHLGIRLGFSIGCDCLGWGVVIPHYGTIVIGSSNRIGNYAVLHTSTTISDNGKIIGDGLYLSTGAKITSQITMGSGVSIGANSLVNKSFLENNIMIGGMPASIIKKRKVWYEEENGVHYQRVKDIEELKKRMQL